MSFLRNMGSVLAFSAVGMPIAFVTSVLLARMLPIDQYGQYGLLMAFVSFLALVSQLGLPMAAIYRVRRLGIPPARVLSAGLVILVAIAALAVGVSVAARQPITARFLGGVAEPVFFAGLAIALAQLVGLFLRGVARAVDRFDLHNRYGLIESAGILLAVVGLWLTGRRDLTAVVAVMLAVELAAVVWMASRVVRQTGLDFRVGRADLRGSFDFGLKTFVQNLTLQLHERVDLLLIAYLLVDPGEAAPYVVAAGLVRIVKVIPTAIATTLFPQLAGLELREAVRFTTRLTRHATLWAFALCALLAPLGALLIPVIYGREYASSVLPFLVLLPSTAGLTLSQIVTRYFTAFDRQGVVIAVRVLATSANVLLNLWLIPLHGIVGAALASLVSYSLEAGLVLTIFLITSDERPGSLVFGSEDLADYSRRLRPLLRRLQSDR